MTKSGNGATKRPARVAGCDLGQASVKLVIGTLGSDGTLVVEEGETVFHQGRPLEVFCDWYRHNEIERCAALGATGLHAGEIVRPAVSGLPEQGCLEAALELVGPQGPLNLVTIGARGYAALARDAQGLVRYVESDKCSSGTGETMVKIAGRFGLSIHEADALAREADESIAITARCSVFAKSEMTHFGNQGRPANALFRGYFGAVATYAAALLARIRVDGPVLLVGGGSRLQALVRAMSEALDQEVLVPESPQWLESLGAMMLAAEQLRSRDVLGELPSNPQELVRRTVRRFEAQQPARHHASRVTRLKATPLPPGACARPAVLGLDLGSTGSKAVLTDARDGRQLLSLYDRTRGNPVQAAQRLVRQLLDTCWQEGQRVDVRAVGVTGSGREAVATVLRAALPSEADRIVVINEIVAHATAAIRCDPDGGESLSVVEIGGQDAKFIQIAGGQIVESDMNKACSAGTGSFLEEQAMFYGIEDIGEFTRLAAEAERPPELGQMCTVFVADAAAEAHSQGFELPDLFGGFQYAVIHNYVNRVMGQRTLARRVFFQGKPASGESLAWTLAAVTDREVVVPADPGAMGAWGIGLCAIDELGEESLLGTAAIALEPFLDAEVVGSSEMQCRDKACQTLCRIEKTAVAVNGEQRTVLSGGACPKFEISTAARPKLDKAAPSAFDERAQLLEQMIREGENGHEGPRVGVPLVGAYQGVMPWLVTLLRGVGLTPEVLRSDSRALSRGEQLCYSFDACAPIKIAHGVVDAGVDKLLMPKLLSLAEDEGGGSTCPMEQALPEMVRDALKDRGRVVHVVCPPLSLQGGTATAPSLSVAEWPQLHAAIEALGGDLRLLARALRLADGAQNRYRAGLAAIGRRSLAYARAHDLQSVVVCGSLHVIHDRAINAGIPGLLREGGVLAIPMDCFEVDADVHPLDRLGWADARKALRSALQSRALGDVYPLLLTAFGCGPSSFAEQLFSMLMAGHPHTVLESDGHGGTAGYATRVQAFLHAVRGHDRRPSEVAPSSLTLLEPLPEPPLEDERSSRMVMFATADRVAPILAAAYRSLGYDTVAAPAADAEALSLGRRDCSGKECLPYQLIWGSFRRHLEEEPPDRRTLLMQITGNGKCRNCMFSVKDQLSVQRLGYDQQVASRHFKTDGTLGPWLVAKVWTGIVLWDLVQQLTAYHRPLESEPGEVDTLYSQLCDEIERVAGRAIRPGWRKVLEAADNAMGAMALVDRACEAFAAIARRAAGKRSTEGLRTVLLSGDIYVRLDAFANDDLTRRLNERRLLVVVEPVWMLAEYMAEERLGEIFGLPEDLLRNTVTKGIMGRIRRSIYGRARRVHPWLPDVEPETLLAEADPILARHPQSEAPVTIGSVLHHWKERRCDGVVLASPWGCGPALISEALLRHQHHIPMMFIYADGSAIDDRRLNAFAFQLRRARRRCALPAILERGKRAQAAGPGAVGG